MNEFERVRLLMKQAVRFAKGDRIRDGLIVLEREDSPWGGKFAGSVMQKVIHLEDALKWGEAEALEVDRLRVQQTEFAQSVMGALLALTRMTGITIPDAQNALQEAGDILREDRERQGERIKPFSQR